MTINMPNEFAKKAFPRSYNMKLAIRFGEKDGQYGSFLAQEIMENIRKKMMD